jgi:dTDP-4-amino-4,6-dideoxygalactose transaminase
MTETVPLVDLSWQHSQIEDEISEGFASVMAETSFVGGPAVRAFEQELATYCGVQRAVGVANGTDAIELGLRALGIGSGDEVILPANTFIATAEAVARAGAAPVLVDCDDEYLLIDPEKVSDAITSRTRAVMGVHLYGQHAPTDALSEVVAGSDIVVFEDAAQAQGATRHGAGIGVRGPAATSFYPGKNLGAYGDGGAVLTQDEELADTVAAIGNHGSVRKYYHDLLGVNSRLDSMQAVVLSAKLKRLEEWNELRRSAASRYAMALGDSEVVRLPATMPGNIHVWHLFVIRVEGRDRLLEALQSDGIGAAIHYPVPVHLHPAFGWLGHDAGSFPVAEAAAGRILSLPIYPGITTDQVDRVSAAVEAHARR